MIVVTTVSVSSALVWSNIRKTSIMTKVGHTRFAYTKILRKLTAQRRYRQTLAAWGCNVQKRKIATANSQDRTGDLKIFSLALYAEDPTELSWLAIWPQASRMGFIRPPGQKAVSRLKI